MENNIEVDSWEEFLQQVKIVDNSYGSHEFIPGHREKNLILYRGQSNSCWCLKSTLERYDPSIQWSVEKYANLAYKCAPQIGSVTNQEWNIPDSMLWREVE